MAKKRRSRPAVVSCPQCGDEFPAGRLACPHCGSDAQTGWKDESDREEFTDEDYEEVVAEIEGRDADAFASDPKWRRRKRMLMVVGLLLVGLFVFCLVKFGSSFW